jgi:hypothetical protein
MKEKEKSNCRKSKERRYTRKKQKLVGRKLENNECRVCDKGVK